MIKKYPCCGGNHSMLDSLFSLMREHNFTYDDVVSAEVAQPYLSIVMMYGEPDTGLQGKFSSQYAVAAALVDGEMGIESYTDEKVREPIIKEAMGKVTQRVVPKADELSVDFDQGIPVKITLKDGRVLEHSTTRQNILGSQHNPWGFDNIKAKFEVNAALALSRERIAETVETWTDIAQVGDVSEAIQRTLVS